MRALPERGTWRGFTEAELDRLGVTEATMRGFMQLVLLYLCDREPTFYEGIELSEEPPCS